MSELNAFDVGLGQYCEDGSPCVVAFDADRNPRLLNEKVYLKSEADKVIAEKDKVRGKGSAPGCVPTLDSFPSLFPLASLCVRSQSYLTLCQPSSHRCGH